MNICPFYSYTAQGEAHTPASLVRGVLEDACDHALRCPKAEQALLDVV